MKNKMLRNGVEMPEVGFGTWKAGETDGFAVLSEAIRAGYRHIDTASAYHTEEAVGRAVAASGVDRSEFFITTKAWKDQLGYDRTLAAFDASCQALGMDYLDLYLIHWPRPDAACEEWKELDRGSWRAMEELYRAGRVRAIGVSNFLPHHLENLLEVCTVPPMVDQIEFHPGYVQWETVKFCRASQILVEAWSPLGRQRLADDPLLAELAGKYGVSQAQICLRFALDCGVVPPAQVGRRWTDAPEPGAGLCPGGGGLGAAADHAPDRLVRPAPGQVSRRDRREPVLPRGCGEDGPFRIYSSDWYWAQTSSTKSQNRWTAGRTLRSLGRNI